MDTGSLLGYNLKLGKNIGTKVGRESVAIPIDFRKPSWNGIFLGVECLPLGYAYRRPSKMPDLHSVTHGIL